MIFKVYSTIVLGQAQTYSQDLKLGHYMKIPPRITFSCQVAATLWACFVYVFSCVYAYLKHTLIKHAISQAGCGHELDAWGYPRRVRS